MKGSCGTVVGMARAAVAIELSPEDEAELRRLLRASSSSQQEALRARIVLRAAAGANNRAIAPEAGAADGRRQPLERAAAGGGHRSLPGERAPHLARAQAQAAPSTDVQVFHR